MREVTGFEMKRTIFAVVLSFIAFATPGLSQRDLPPPQRSEKFNTPCTINSYASWCAIKQVAGGSVVELHFAHGDQPIFKWVKIGPAQDDPKVTVIRSVSYDEKWTLRNYRGSYSTAMEVGGFENTICFGPAARKPYPQGCGKP